MALVSSWWLKGLARYGALALVAASGALTGTPPAQAAGLAVQVTATTKPVINSAGSATTATVACPTGTVLVSGGVRVYAAAGDSVVTGSTYEPINGLVMRGTYPSDTLGATSTAANPAHWSVQGGFAGQAEAGDMVTGYALCTTGGPTSTRVLSSTIRGPTAAAGIARATATCPAGTTLVGGGGLMGPTGTLNASPSQKVVGSYPSDPTGTMVSSAPTSWSAVGSAGGRADPDNFTTAFAICGSGSPLTTRVVRADRLGHPAGPGNSNPGSDPVATATATCPVGTTLLAGGELADATPPPLQQGVHVRGSYPSDAAGRPLTTAPRSWSAVVQSGGQPTPGTNTHAFALCATLPASPSADLAASLAGPSTGRVSTPVTYTVRATNRGPSPATTVTVVDAVSGGASVKSAHPSQGTCSLGAAQASCSMGSLAAGATVTVTVVAALPATPGTVTNTASATGAQPDPIPANNSARITTTVTP